MSPHATVHPEYRRFEGTAAVFFTPHMAVDDREWRLIREFGNAYHPLRGYYRSDDPDTLRQQLRWMRRAGLDLIVYDAYATHAMGLHDLPRDPVLPLLLDLLAHQEEESRRLQMCFYLEKYLGNPSIEEYDFALDFIRRQVAEHPGYYRYHGRPLVLTYLNGENRAISDVEYRNSYFSLQRVRPWITDVWSYVENHPQTPRKDWMPASPGIDAYLELAFVAKYVNKTPEPDFEKIRREAPRADRENGEYFRRQLARTRECDPEIIFISGWNDWQYGTQIEPAAEYEHQYLDLAAAMLGRVPETEPYRRGES